MTMQMLVAAGVPVITDGTRKAGQDNPRGYFEDDRVMNLHKNGVDQCWLLDVRGCAIKIIAFLLKDLPDTNNYKVIFMQRDLNEVLASQRKMLERRGEPHETSDERMLELWEDQLWRAKYLLSRAPQFTWIEVAYRDAINDPIGQARRISDFLGGGLDIEKMSGSVDAKLYRNRS